MAAAVAASGGGGCGGKKRKCERPVGLGELHDDMLERVLARLPPASCFRLRGVCRRWLEAAGSPTFLAACARVPARDPWFLMLSDQQERQPPCPAVAFDTAEGTWARCRGASGAVPVAATGGLVLYRAPDTGALTVANPLTGASRALPRPPAASDALHAVAMYGSPYRVVLILGELPDLSMTAFDSSKNAWEEAVVLSRKPEASLPDATAPDSDDDDTVYFLNKSGDVVATNMQRSASRQYSSVVTCRDGDEAVAYFLSHSGAVVACDLARRVFAELPRILPVYFEYSIDVVACDGRAYVVILSEYLDTASLRVWEFADGAWRQVAAMPPAMSHAFYGKKADVNCVAQGDRVMVCVSSGEANGCFMCGPPRLHRNHKDPRSGRRHDDALQEEPQEARPRLRRAWTHRQASEAPRRARKRRWHAPPPHPLRQVSPGLLRQGRHALLPQAPQQVPLPGSQHRAPLVHGAGRQGLRGRRQGARPGRDAVRLHQGAGQGDAAAQEAHRRQGQARLKGRREEDQGGRRRRPAHRLGKCDGRTQGEGGRRVLGLLLGI